LSATTGAIDVVKLDFSTALGTNMSQQCRTTLLTAGIVVAIPKLAR
jgi:hypothetical protein